MALPIAHATAGYLVHRLDRRATAFGGWPRALTYVALANLPDADFLLGYLLGRPGAFHRGLSHTVLAAVVVGIAGGAFSRWRWRDSFAVASLGFAAAYGSHLLLDAFTIDQRGPAGAQFFWPLSDVYVIAPFTVFTEILIDGSSRAGFVASIWKWPTIVVLMREAAIAATVVAALSLADSRRARNAREASAAAFGTEPGESGVA